MKQRQDRTDPRKYAFSVRAVEKWNKLPVPEEVRAAPSRAAFRDCPASPEKEDPSATAATSALYSAGPVVSDLHLF